MSESLGRAVLELVANINPLKAGLAEGQAASEKMAATTASSFHKGITKAAMPAALGLGVLVLGMHKAIDAAQADQIAQARLATAYKSSGLDVNKYGSQIDGVVQSSAALGFKSEDVKTALGSLIVATHDNGKALALLSTAQDIARYKNIDLASATKMLVMAQTGSQRATKQLGLSVQAVTTQQDKAKAAAKAQQAALVSQMGSTTKMSAAQRTLYDRLSNNIAMSLKANLATAKIKDTQATAAQVIGLVNQKLHGQADAYAATAAGAKAKLGAEVTLLEENLGKALLPAITAVTGGLARFTGFMAEHATVAKVVIAVLAGLAIAILAVNTYLKLEAAFTALATAAEWLFNTAMDANPLMLVVVGLVALGVALVIAWNKSKTFRDVVLGVWGAIKSGVSAVIGFFTHTIPAAFESVLGWVRSHWPMIAVLLSGPFAPLVALATNAFGVRSALTGALTSVWNFAKGVWSSLGQVWGAAWNGAWGLVKGVINFMIGGINALIGAWDSLHFHFGGVMGIGAFDVGVPQIPKIPLLAQGGIVTKPTLAMVGEAGPEAVIPLGHALRRGGGSDGPHFHFHGFVGNERDIAVKFGRELQKLKVRGVDFGLA